MVHYVVLDFSTCEADIDYYSGRYDPDTRQWLLKDFDEWFSDPGDSRAYVLLGDAGVGKSVMAAVISQRAIDSGNMAAAFFCHHYDDTRRDPRYLLGSIAYQLCHSFTEYDKTVGGEDGIRCMLRSELGVHELFTKLLQEPLGKCDSCAKKKLVVVDALDESEYWSREDFLALITRRFPFLPKWLVFFITSRPEDTVQYRLERYNPCIKICAGDSDSTSFYHNHILDIQQFLKKSLNFRVSADFAVKLTKKCNGMFLYAFYLAEILKDQTDFHAEILPENIYDYFRENFKRIYDKIDKEFYQKFFGCLLMTPSPLPCPFVSFLLKRENSTLDEQEVIDAVSQFVVLRKTDNCFEFRHSVIPVWLTNKKDNRDFSVDKKKAKAYFSNIIVHFLNAFLQEKHEKLSDEIDLVNYMLCVGFRFICNCQLEDSDILFNSLTNFRFLQQRIDSRRTGIYSLIDDFKQSIQKLFFNDVRKGILGDICFALERDRFVLIGSPQLLHSCLCSSDNLVTEKIIPETISAAWMEESSIKELAVLSFLPDFCCSTFSHDKKLFAAVSSHDQSLYLYDACSFEKIEGPIRLADTRICHLEFSLDDKFVFFGRLDLWFSMKERRVVEFSQFSENSVHYDFGSCICNGTYIVVRKAKLKTKLSLACVTNMFFNWAKYESHKSPANDKFVILFYRNAHFNLCSCEDCHHFRELVAKCDETGIYRRILAFYAEIFVNQIWNLNTGRPVLEEMFSSHFEPFFYVWHLFPGLSQFYADIPGRAQTFTFFDVALINAYSVAQIDSNSTPSNIVILRNISREWYSLFNDGKNMFSKDGKWRLYYCARRGECALFETENEDLRPSDLFPDSLKKDLEIFAFTDNSNFLVYTTHSSSGNLYALSLQNGTNLQSILCPQACFSGDVQGLGFIFSSANESTVVFVSDLPTKFVQEVFANSKIMFDDGIKASFTSRDSVSFLCVDGNLWEITGGCLSKPSRKILKLELFPNKKIHVKKAVFSHNGQLIAMHQSREVLLVNTMSRSHSSIFKVEDECVHALSCLAFSPDDYLLFFCIEKSNSDRSFYVYNLQQNILTRPFSLPFQYDMHVDCCCFSFADKSKLFLCNTSSILILKYEVCEPAIEFSSSISIPNINSSASDVCSHCTVSSENDLLACCIANEIFICQPNHPDRFSKVTHKHQGKIEYCKFLCGSRYLLSYGIDGLVFLFDLVRWETIAYVGEKSIISMAVSPEEDKIICLGSSGQINLTHLHQLERSFPSHFELPSNLLSVKRTDPVQGVHFRIPSVHAESEEDDFLSDQEGEMSPYSSESSDNPDASDITPEHNACDSVGDE